MSHKRVILLILGITLLVYSNSLFNEFIGDAKYIFTYNTFYKSLDNFPRIFQKDFVMNTPQLESLISREVAFSGCVSYRPVTAVFFFLDYFLWGDNPAGHHFTNVILHALTAISLYFLCLILFKIPVLAIMSALIFAVHPIHSEVVNGIGYRSDILSTLFFTLAFYTYIQFRDKRRLLYLGISYIAFFISLFAKETALMFPLLILCYEFCFHKEERAIYRQIFKSYLGYFGILVFYCYIYFFVIPSQFYPKFLISTASIWETALINIKIFLHYMSVIVFPFKVTVLPTLYAPDASSINLFDIVTFIGVCSVMIWAMIYSFYKQRKELFLLLWFVLMYLPVSNLMPLLNPFAFRFMYLPSMGLIIMLAWIIEKSMGKMEHRWGKSRMKGIIRIAILALCIAATIPNNEFFKNDITASGEMVRNYPDSSRPYWILGLNYLDNGIKDKAEYNLLKYLEMDPRNVYVLPPKANFAVYHLLGRARAEFPDETIRLNEHALKLKPDFLFSLVDMSKAYILKKDFQSALIYAKKSIELKKDFIYGYIFAIHSLIELERFEEAEALLKYAFTLAPEDENLVYLRTWINRIEQ